MKELEHVLPPDTGIMSNGHLTIAGCDTIELAHEFGTPLFVYDEGYLRDRLCDYEAAFARTGLDTEIVYASKAFACLAMSRLICEYGLSIDVSTAGELECALRGGIDPCQIVMHGNNKSDAEIDTCVELGVGRIVIDSFDDIDRIRTAVVRCGISGKVGALLRLTPGVDASTHEHIRTGQEDSKFGLGVRNGQAMAAVDMLSSIDEVDLVGVHSHIGSQIFDMSGFAESIGVLVDFAAEASNRYGRELREFNVGGGLGIAYGADDRPIDVSNYAEVLASHLADAVDRVGIVAPKLVVEPGRSIVGRAGVTLYEVGVIKELPGLKTYVSVDGGMSDNLRPALYDAEYEALIANRAAQDRSSTVTVAGKHCESGDIVVENARLPVGLRRGEILAVPATGAYGYSMANNYNMVPRPAVVFCKSGNSRVVIAREMIDDLMRGMSDS